MITSRLRWHNSVFKLQDRSCPSSHWILRPQWKKKARWKYNQVLSIALSFNTALTLPMEVRSNFLTRPYSMSSSETQGQLVGSIKWPWWKFTVRSRRALGHLLLPKQFQKRLNCPLLIGQKKFFLANQRRGAAGWLWCFLTRPSFPHRSP